MHTPLPIIIWVSRVPNDSENMDCYEREGGGRREVVGGGRGWKLGVGDRGGGEKHVGRWERGGGEGWREVEGKDRGRWREVEGKDGGRWREVEGKDGGRWRE